MTTQRRYLKTHPWITFSADLRRASPSLWLLLGEARSKCEHVSGVPLLPSVAQGLFTMYLAKGVHATTAIEGNTLTEEEVAKHLAGKLTVPPSKEYQKTELDNMIREVNEIVSGVRQGGPKEDISPELVCRLNAGVLKGLELEAGVVPGMIRKHEVGVLRYPGAPAADCPYLLERLCRWLNEEKFDADGSFQISAAIIKAIIAHLYIAWIHPFGDGNGRTARLVEFYLLVNAGVSVPSAHLLSDHYNQTRAKYYQNLDYASKSGGDIIPFINYAVSGFVEELKKQLAIIRAQQWNLSWRDYVNEIFEGDNSPTASRRKCLVIDLSWSEPVPRAKLALISARVAQCYARKTEKTLSRDLNWLEAQGLVEKTKKGFRARPEIILSFLPPRWSKAAQTVDEIPTPKAPVFP